MSYRLMVIQPSGLIELETVEPGIGERQRLVGGNFECLPICEDPQVTGWVNEDGISLGLPHNRLATKLCTEFKVGMAPSDYIKGAMVFTGMDQEGNTCSVPEGFVARVIAMIDSGRMDAAGPKSFKDVVAGLKSPYGLDDLTTVSPRQLLMDAALRVTDVSPRQIAEEIVATATRILGRAPSCGTDGAVFFSPAGWRDLGHQVNETVVLIVTHDGGDLARFFNWAYEDRQAMNARHESLRELGCYTQKLNPAVTAIHYRQP